MASLVRRTQCLHVRGETPPEKEDSWPPAVLFLACGFQGSLHGSLVKSARDWCCRLRHQARKRRLFRTVRGLFTRESCMDQSGHLSRLSHPETRARFAASGPGMSLAVDGLERRSGQVSVYLGRAQTGMPQKFLEGTQVGAAIQEVRRVRMP